MFVNGKLPFVRCSWPSLWYYCKSCQIDWRELWKSISV